jgi:hypothetical protein
MQCLSEKERKECEEGKRVKRNKHQNEIMELGMKQEKRKFNTMSGEKKKTGKGRNKKQYGKWGWRKQEVEKNANKGEQES